MEKLTKKQRHGFYLKMLDVYVKDKREHFWYSLYTDTCYYGLCHVVGSLSYGAYNINCFPEIMKGMPENAHIHAFWWNRYDKAPRIEILKQAIKETE